MEPEADQSENTLSFDRFWWVGIAFAGVVVIGRLVPYAPVQNVFEALGYPFSWLTRTALSITQGLFESYGYLTCFLAPLMENTILLGALIPGTLVMMLAGLSAHDGLIRLWFAVPLAIAGAWIGDTVSYGIGRFGWQRLGAESRLVRMSERMRGPLLRSSVWLVMMYHFAGYSRLIGPAASGFIRMPFPRWVVLDYAGSALWVCTYMAVGYVLGVLGLSLDASDRNVRVFELILFAFGAFALITIVTRAQRASDDDGEPIGT